ncbi:MAG: hypothetical protein Q4C53_03170 [Clostridia bacterium]|nr:hypothetical protein [Clostridia bacterium]
MTADAERLRTELTTGTDAAAWQRTQRLLAESAVSDALYPMLPLFFEMIRDAKSQVRIRGMHLACAQARWDTEGKLMENAPALFAMLNDPKPVAVRRTLSALREVALFRPEMEAALRKAVENIVPERYPDSMAPLIRKDAEALSDLLD